MDPMLDRPGRPGVVRVLDDGCAISVSTVLRLRPCARRSAMQSKAVGKDRPGRAGSVGDIEDVEERVPCWDGPRRTGQALDLLLLQPRSTHRPTLVSPPRETGLSPADQQRHTGCR